MSKNLLFPKSPLDEILTNFPLRIIPINLKLLNFLAKGVSIFSKLISISLLIEFKNSFFSLFSNIFESLVESYFLPEILIFFPKFKVKSFFKSLSVNVFTLIFLRDLIRLLIIRRLLIDIALLFSV